MTRRLKKENKSKNVICMNSEELNEKIDEIEAHSNIESADFNIDRPTLINLIRTYYKDGVEFLQTEVLFSDISNYFSIIFAFSERKIEIRIFL